MEFLEAENIHYIKLTEQEAREIVLGENTDFDIIKRYIINRYDYLEKDLYKVIVYCRLNEKYYSDVYFDGYFYGSGELPYQKTAPGFLEVKRKERIEVYYE